MRASRAETAESRRVGEASRAGRGKAKWGGGGGSEGEEKIVSPVGPEDARVDRVTAPAVEVFFPGPLSLRSRASLRG